jgi:hypothetical protein
MAGGRPKGSMNKNNLKALLSERLEARFGKEWSPVIEMVEQAMRLKEISEASNDVNDISATVSAMDKASRYLVPQLKSMEVSTDKELTVSIQRKNYGSSAKPKK